MGESYKDSPMTRCYNIDISNFQSAILKITQRPFWAVVLLRRTSVLPQAKPRRRDGFAIPSISMPKGEAGRRHAESTKKDTTYVVSFFVAHRYNLDIFKR